ncbi:CaiB/BaiF CoA-transferase family protein [Simiduia curdlanivorans]|uniref:CaiB/BaiF CoA transferase family protein n=1 Tax=Simiduia curdlanivorans TaxID=1492769 RepID=A0ABV8V6H4_9GAMM|nr:CaiB/BaiF CoA-transferase family protein [Simiduia curdlanivorans]MDN3638819.1 CaiB/BaiF CoA-transferase family protein [Simiduia curdlanivorans]
MGPLTGIKIIEMKGIGPGPYAGQVLADLGAEVVVVERVSKPNSIAPPSAQDVNSRGKKSIALNLRTTEGLNTLLTLVEKADVIFEGNRPGVAERLGFGPDECLARNPKIIYGRMTGWGQTGPLAQSAGHDYNYISLTGVAAAIGSQAQPTVPLNVIGDYAGGSLFLVIGILSALLEVQKSGKGQVIDSAITDGSAHLMSMFYTLNKLGFWNPSRQSNLLDGGVPYYGAYETADGKHLSVGPIEPKFFAEMIRRADLPEEFIQHQNNPEKWDEIKAALSHTFKSKTRAQWVDIFEGSDACVTGILDYQEAIEHPHNKARGTYIEINGVQQPAPAPKFSRSECAIPAAPSAEGADTKALLAAWGFDSVAISALEEAGALS